MDKTPAAPVVAADATVGENKPAVATMAVQTAYDASLLRDALRARIEDLNSLAKKCQDNNYLRQASEIRMDADRLKLEYLIKLEPQAELSFGPSDPRDAAKLLIGTGLRATIKDRALVEKILDKLAGPVADVLHNGIVLGYETGNAGASSAISALALRAFARTIESGQDA